MMDFTVLFRGRCRAHLTCRWPSAPTLQAGLWSCSVCRWLLHFVRPLH